MKTFDVVIIGDGFCSLLTAAQLVRSERNLKIAVAGRSPDWGPGLAYGRCHAQHLLNVPAGRMSAFPDEPDDFLDWLKKNVSAEKDFTRAFVPRKFYGQYLRDIAKEILPAVTYSTDEIENISFDNGAVVLATGVPITADSKTIDPWHFDFSVLKDSTEPVAITGTGLTMVDVVSTLALQNFKGKITAVSRRGLVPEPHAETDEGDKVKNLGLRPIKGTLAQKMQAVRDNAAMCVKAGMPWQSYMDHLRTSVPELWQALSTAEQKKFIARILPYWNVHRHRQPAETVKMIQDLMEAGQLEILRAHQIPKTKYVFNCRGPDYSLRSEPLLQNMIKQGFLQKNENGIGVKVDKNLSAIGKAHGKLFVAGCLTAGVFFESTAVPELREQCVKIAEIISGFSSGYCQTGAAASGTG